MPEAKKENKKITYHGTPEHDAELMRAATFGLRWRAFPGNVRATDSELALKTTRR